MVGSLGAFVNGSMFMGLLGSDVGIKLPEGKRQRLPAEPGAGPFGPQEHPTARYLTLPADWIGRPLAYAAGLPPRKPEAPAKPRR